MADKRLEKNVNLVHDALTTTTRLLCRYISHHPAIQIQIAIQPSSRAACHKAIKQEAWHFNLQAERRRASWFEEGTRKKYTGFWKF